MSLPDFFIIGAPKAGSTALHSALAHHPDLYLSPVKEPKFFLHDGHPRSFGLRQRGPGDAHSAREWIWDADHYRGLFADARPGQLRGESTPFYLWSNDAHARLAATVPSAKLIAVVRDPVDRAYSNWTHLWCDGLEPEKDFRTACDLEPIRAEAGWAPFWRYLGLGRYGEQLQNLYTHYDPAQVHVLRYRQLVDEPAETLDRICQFLGVRTGAVSAIGSSNVSTWVPDSPVNTVLRRTIRAGAHLGQFAPPQVWRTVERPLRAALHRGHRNRPEPDPIVRMELVARFADDIALLSQLTGEDYSDWLSETGRGTYSVRKS
jgi:sulfotransferase family protein